MVQLHKRLTDSQVKELIERYVSKEIERGSIQEVLGIGKRGFLPSSKRIATIHRTSLFTTPEQLTQERYLRRSKRKNLKNSFNPLRERGVGLKKPFLKLSIKDTDAVKPKECLGLSHFCFEKALESL